MNSDTDTLEMEQCLQGVKECVLPPTPSSGSPFQSREWIPMSNPSEGYDIFSTPSCPIVGQASSRELEIDNSPGEVSDHCTQVRAATQSVAKGLKQLFKKDSPSKAKWKEGTNEQKQVPLLFRDAYEDMLLHSNGTLNAVQAPKQEALQEVMTNTLIETDWDTSEETIEIKREQSPLAGQQKQGQLTTVTGRMMMPVIKVVDGFLPLLFRLYFTLAAS